MQVPTETQGFSSLEMQAFVSHLMRGLGTGFWLSENNKILLTAKPPLQSLQTHTQLGGGGFSPDLTTVSVVFVCFPRLFRNMSYISEVSQNHSDLDCPVMFL